MSEKSRIVIRDYLAALRKNLARRDATEGTHRPALKSLLETISDGITATNEPKRIVCGAPDFNVTRKSIPVGHVETKDIGSNIGEMERGRGPNGEQFIRYRDGLLNWILTDYVEFHWYVSGEKRLTARIGNVDGTTIRSVPAGDEQLTQLFEAFFTQPALTISTPKDLAERLAGMTHIIRDLIRRSFEREVETGWLHSWLTAFREVLIPDLRPFLTDEERKRENRPPVFDDMFAQTLAYGLFAARIHTPQNNKFSREMAAFNLPKTNPFLRKLFSEIAGVDMPEIVGWAVDEIVELLTHANIHEILKDFGRATGRKDPLIHFYETFLAAYDPTMRKKRGVYYTPEAVVAYIVSSIDHLLKTRFKRPRGLADENTLILDPATGTATFLYFVVNHIFEGFTTQRGAWDAYVGDHLLNRIFGFELLIASYAIGHLKLGMQLQESGYKFGSDQRLGIYLTNTLEEAAKKSEQLFARWIADEANAAAKIKRDEPILVVLGNPPYSGHSANRSWDEIPVKRGQEYVAGFAVEQGRVVEVKKKAKRDSRVKVPTFIGRLMRDYYIVDGAALDEKNPKWLQNDYVKFIRFAQWRIGRTGEGIIAYITAHSYLDNPTFRGMRQQLMDSFNEIYVYDLHGNPQKEKSPDGSKDENVFDITQGVAILFCVKQKENAELARVWHAEIWGKRQNKYELLLKENVGNTDWRELSPARPFYLFVPQDTTYLAEYQAGTKITDAMPVNTVGVVTGRDEDAIAWTPEDAAYLARSHGLSPDVVKPIYFRPFDIRFVVYDKQVVTRRRYKTMRHMLMGSNLALITSRLTKGETFKHAQATRNISEVICMSPKTSNNGFLFPLYLYQGTEQELALQDARHLNFDRTFLKTLAEKLGLPQRKPDDVPDGISAEQIFYYIYAILHSPTYRTRYAEFLKRDFPRLPLTSDLSVFCALAATGEQLVALHLLESPILNDYVTEFPIKGSNQVERIEYRDERVWINEAQYFAGVPKLIWEFQVGGYQVCNKWLEDRKNRKLSYGDIQHYQKIILALSKTIRAMDDVDALIPSWPIN